MNLRQKAKKFKKLAEINAEKAAAFDRMQFAENFANYITEREVETLKCVSIIDDGYIKRPEEEVQREAAQKLGECLLENNLMHYKVDQSCDFKGVRTATMWVKVIKPK
jgi:hypothetical protein